MVSLGHMTLDSIIHRSVHFVGIVTVIAGVLYVIAKVLRWAKDTFSWSWIPESIVDAPTRVTSFLCRETMTAELKSQMTAENQDMLSVPVGGGGAGSVYAQTSADIDDVAEGGICMVLASQKCGHCRHFVDTMLAKAAESAAGNGVGFKVFDMDTMSEPEVKRVAEGLANKGLPIEYVPLVLCKLDGTLQKVKQEKAAEIQGNGVVTAVTPEDTEPATPQATPPATAGGAAPPREPRADYSAGPTRAEAAPPAGPARAEAAPPAARPAAASGAAARCRGRTGAAAPVNFA